MGGGVFDRSKKEEKERKKEKFSKEYSASNMNLFVVFAFGLLSKRLIWRGVYLRVVLNATGTILLLCTFTVISAELTRATVLTT
jgi:hypothetical protein